MSTRSRFLLVMPLAFTTSSASLNAASDSLSHIPRSGRETRQLEGLICVNDLFNPSGLFGIYASSLFEVPHGETGCLRR